MPLVIGIEDLEEDRSNAMPSMPPMLSVLSRTSSSSSSSSSLLRHKRGRMGSNKQLCTQIDRTYKPHTRTYVRTHSTPLAPWNLFHSQPASQPAILSMSNLQHFFLSSFFLLFPLSLTPPWAGPAASTRARW